MPYNIELPDGTLVEDIPDEVSPQDAKKRLSAAYPQFNPVQPQGGFFPALKHGFEGVKQAGAALAGRTGMMDTAAAEKYIQESEAKQKQIFKGTEEGWTEAPGTKIAELLGGSLPYMAAPIAAGAAAAFGGAPALVGAGLAGLASGAQFTGTNLGRQMDEGKKLGETDLGSAALAAIPQAALDMVGFKMLPGIRRLFMEAGKDIGEEAAKKIAQEGFKAVAKDYALSTGKAIGAEGITEAAQQVFERLQAGLSITDPAAQQEYWDNFLGGAVLGGVMAPAGRYVERGGEKQKAAQLQQIAAAKAFKEKQAAEEVRAREQAGAGPPEQQGILPGFERPPAAPVQEQTPEQRQAAALTLAQQQSEAAGLLEDNQQAMSDAAEQGDAAALVKLSTQRAALQNEHDTVATKLKELGGYTDAPAELAKAQKALIKANADLVNMAGAGFDPEKGAKLAAKITALQEKIDALGGPQQAIPEEQYDMFGGKSETGQQWGQRLSSEARQEELARAAKEVDQQAAEEARVGAVAPEIQALRRIAQRPTPSVGTGQISPLVDKLVSTFPQHEPQAYGVSGRVIPGIAPEISAPQELRAQLAYANATGNKELVNTLRKQLADVPPENAIDAEQVTRAAGVEGALSPAARRENRATQLAQQQLGAYDKLAGFLEDVKFGGIKADKPEILKHVETLRRTAVGLALNEIDARRAANGQAPMTVDEQLRAVRNIGAPLDELISRSQRLLEQPGRPGAPAQMRGKVLVRGPEEAVRPGKGGRTFGSFTAAADTLRGEMRDTIDTHTGLTPRPVKERGKPTRVEAVLRRPTETPALPADEVFRKAAESKAAPEDKALIARVDAVRDRLGAAGQETVLEQAQRVADGKPINAKYELQTLLALHERAVRDEGGVRQEGKELVPQPTQRELFSLDTAAATERSTKAALETAKADLTKLNEQKKFSTLQDAAAAIKQRTALQEKVKDLATQLRGTAQDKSVLRKEQARQQGEVGFMRATPANFQRALQSGEVFKLQQQATELRKQLEMQAKRAATITATAEAKEKAAAEFRTKVEAGRKTPVEAAKAAYERAREKAGAAVPRAVEVVAPREQELAAAAEIVEMLGENSGTRNVVIGQQMDENGNMVPIKLKTEKEGMLFTAKKMFDEVVERLAYLEHAHEWHKAELDAGRAPKTNRTQLAKIEKQLPGIYDDVLRASRYLDDISKLHDKAKARQQAVKDAHAADVVGTSLIREGRQARERVRAAEERLLVAQENERSAARGLKLLQEEAAKKPPEPKPSEVWEGPKTRVFRDTSAPRVQEAVTAIRKTIAMQEGLYEKAQATGDTAAMQTAARVIDNAYEKLYATLASAPVRKVSSEDAALLAQHAEYEAAQQRAFEAEEAVSRAEKGLAAPKLPARRKGPVVVGASPAPSTMRTGTEESKTGATTTPTRHGPRKEGVAKPLKGSVIEDIAAKRVELAEVQRQLTFMAENKAATKEGKAKQNAARKELAKQKVAITQELTSLAKEDAKVALGEAAVRKQTGIEKKRLLRAAKNAPETAAQTAIEEGGEGTAGEMEFSKQTEPVARGNTHTVKSLTDAIKDFMLVGSLGRNVFVVGSVSELPSEVRALRPSLKDAVAFTKDGKAYLIADRIAKGNERGVFLHEVGAHLGMQRMLGAEYGTIVDQLYKWVELNDGSKESLLAQRAVERVGAADTKSDQYDSELLAYFIEEAVNSGIDPTATAHAASGLERFVRGIWAAFKTVMRKLNQLRVDELTAQDLVDMAYGSARINVTGTWHGTPHKVGRFQLQKIGTGEGAQAYGWGLYFADKRGVAEGYRDKLSRSSNDQDVKTAAGRIVDDTELDELSWLHAVDFPHSIAHAELDPKWKTILEEFVEVAKPLVAEFDKADDAIKRLDKEANAAYDAWKGKNDERAGELFEKLHDELMAAYDSEKALAPRLKNVYANTSSGRQKIHIYGSADARTKLDTAERFLQEGLVVGDGQPQKTGNLYAADFAIADDEWLLWNKPLEQQSQLVQEGLAQIKRRPVRASPRGEPGRDIYDSIVIGNFQGGDKARSLKLDSVGIKGIKYQDYTRARNNKNQTFNYVVFNDKNIIKAIENPRRQDSTDVQFSKAIPNERLAAAHAALAGLTVREKTVWEKVHNNALGLRFRTSAIDGLATLEKIAYTDMEALKGMQMMSFLRMYGQRMHFTSMAIGTGVPQLTELTRKDGRKEWIYEAEEGASIKKVVDVLTGIKGYGTADQLNEMFTQYLAAFRAKNKGVDVLNFAKKFTQAQLDELVDAVHASPELKAKFTQARDIYNEYNRNLLKLAADTGVISRALATKLLAENDYIPFYRVDKDGIANLFIGNETPVRIGNLKDNPQLQELVGGEEPIFDFLTSSVQNTAMLVDASMRNQATKNAMFRLVELGAAKMGIGSGPKGAVGFNEHGVEKYAIIDSEKYGVPSALLVQGLAGIPTMLPAIVRMMGVPSRLLRRSVTASPVYMAKQLFRDSSAAAMASGANIIPVASALKQIGKGATLTNRGVTGGQVFTGTGEDMTRLLREMQAGRPGWSKLFSKLEAMSMEADALTRRAQYDSYIQQGLSEMEATLMSLESMNFSRRGISPSLHMVATMIPFFNAQIQSLDVLYRAFRGKMPMNERLQIQRKLLERGALVVGMSLLYAMLMQDDKSYKNAKPEEKAASFFVRVPGLEEAVRVPVPFELGYIFKSLPEALYNMLVNEHGGEDALKALRFILLQTIPGGSSYGLPQAMRPGLEVASGISTYTGRSIESAQEQEQEPWKRYRDNTSEIAKHVGAMLNISPIKIEYLVRGYTGGMGLALLQTLSLAFPRMGSDKALGRMSDLPVFGTLFQPEDSGAIIDATYERMQEFTQAQRTYEGLLKDGNLEGAKKYLLEHSDKIARAALAGNFTQQMGELTQYEAAIRASNKTPTEKRESLDKIRQVKIKFATAMRAAAVDKKEHQAALH